MNLTILYRGPLESCNYGCWYCPFAKHNETAEEHAADAAALNRFVTWAEDHPSIQLSVFFTPWGEALIHRRYQQAFARLTNLPHVKKVAIQTNLSCRLEWVEDCDKEKIGLWATYHPGEVKPERFLSRCRELIKRGVNFSVGIVGLKENIDEIERMRAVLPESVYLWVNAFKRVPDYYTDDDIVRITNVDPLFPINNVRHPSLGKPCHTGHSVISVNGDGDIRRCHFVKQKIGNLYDPDFEQVLMPRTCPNVTCGCHIGYVHMPELGLYDVYGERVLERIIPM